MWVVGWIIGLLVLPRLADLKGRRDVFFTMIWLNFWAVLMSLMSKNLALTQTLIVLNGVDCVSRWSIGFILLLEFFPLA